MRVDRLACRVCVPIHSVHTASRRPDAPSAPPVLIFRVSHERLPPKRLFLFASAGSWYGVRQHPPTCARFRQWGGVPAALAFKVRRKQARLAKTVNIPTTVSGML